MFPEPGRESSVTWHFDEIQLVGGWERFVRRLLETEGDDVIVTGSSAGLLSQEIATSLRGRGWRILLHPFSFEEALRHNGKELPLNGTGQTAHVRSRMESAYIDWINTGGFPEAQGLEGPSRRQLYRDYVDVAMLRDVVERHNVRNVTGLRWLVRQLLGNAGVTLQRREVLQVPKIAGDRNFQGHWCISCSDTLMTAF